MASITCGNCNQTHTSVNAVKYCYRVLSPTGLSSEAFELFRPDPAQVRMEDRSTVTARPPAGGPVTEEGMYRDASGTIFKVVKAVHGSGKLYAKELRIDQTTTAQDRVSNAGGHFVYKPGAIRALSTNDKMSLEDAKAFGKLYGFCCRCGAILTDENSIEAGIGPICASKW